MTEVDEMVTTSLFFIWGASIQLLKLYSLLCWMDRTPGMHVEVVLLVLSAATAVVDEASVLLLKRAGSPE